MTMDPDVNKIIKSSQWGMPRQSLGNMPILAEPECEKCGYMACQCASENARQANEDRAIMARLMAGLGGRRAYETFTVEKFQTTPGNKVAFAAAKSFSPLMDNLYLFGPTGVGKSHLAAIAGRQGHQDIGCLPITIKPMLAFRSIRAAQSAGEEEGILRKLIQAPILIVDELGISKDTEFAITVLYEIIEGRWMDMRNGLIVTSNLSLDELASKMGTDRLTSRLAGLCGAKIFKVTGKDWRLHK